MSAPRLPMPQRLPVGQYAAGSPPPRTEAPSAPGRREVWVAEAHDPQALVVEPCNAHAKALGSALQRAGFAVVHAANAEEVSDAALRSARFQLILCEQQLPGQSGLGLLRRVRQACPETAFFVLTGQPDVASSVSALSLGATEYLTKPLDESRLLALCRAAVVRTSRCALGEPPISHAAPPHDECAELVALSSAMRGLLLRLPGLSQSAAPVLLHGEPGSGKRLLAQVVHRLSACAAGPLLIVRPDELGPRRLPLVLWGKVATALGGSEQAGAVQKASGGSLIITEVERLSAPDRWLLARLITRGLYRPVGSTQERMATVRVLLTTSQPVGLLTSEPEEDLLPGLRCVELRVPPLRERTEDVVALATRMLAELATPPGTPPLVLTADSERLLQDYRWPGNGSELRAALVTAVSRATGPELGPELLPVTLGLEPTTLTVASGPLTPSDRLVWRALRRVVARLPMSYRGQRRPWGPIWTLARVLGERRRHHRAEVRGDGC